MAHCIYQGTYRMGRLSSRYPPLFHPLGIGKCHGLVSSHARMRKYLMHECERAMTKDTATFDELTVREAFLKAVGTLVELGLVGHA